MTDTTTQDSEHLDESLRKLREEGFALREENRRLRSQRADALRICRDQYQYGERGIHHHLVDAEAIRGALGG